ncbi:MAG TPA: PqqD family protein [Gemmatimonadales bacterium]|nr:PqqD family protein [Gemmatimonadales bacterium]
MTDRYRRHHDLRLAALEDEGVILHLGSRSYFTVSESGVLIFEALATPHSVEELVAVLQARYEVNAEQAEASVRDFLERCRAADLLEIEAGA